MWRLASTHERGETEFLDDAMIRIRANAAWRARAETVLRDAALAEPLIDDLLHIPQSPPHHGEGPFVRDHLVLMLSVLFAILDEQFHLIDVEEFRRMKGYEGEWDELEETIKEQAGFFIAFALCHDAAKAATMKKEETAEGLRIHYPGHDRAIHTPVYRALLERVCETQRLPSRDVDLLEDVIAWHLEPIQDFAKEKRPERISHYEKFATERGHDADDFLDILQAGVLLDIVCASACVKAHGVWHNSAPLIHFLQSEHDFAPHRRGEKQASRDEEEGKRIKLFLREAELDGD